jgi:acyl-CoA synthetase (AMP-forming)/AMP-acid ligase II
VTDSSHVERLFVALENRPANPAVIFEGQTFTFGDLDLLSRRYARGLAAACVMPGDRVAIFAETSPEVILALLGHYRLGAVHVPINTRYQREETAHILEDSGARWVLLRAGSPCARVLEELGTSAASFRRIWIGGRDPAARSGDLAFADLTETSLPRAEANAPPQPVDSDAAVLLYTSGTTGVSKGVELSFRAIVGNTEAVTRLWRFSSEDRMPLVLPLFHVHGLCLGVHGAILHGIPLLLFERFEARAIARAFERDGATIFQGVPTMYVKLLELLAESSPAAEALAGGRLFTAGSAPLPADDFERFEEQTGHRILERYGMSETLFTLSNPYEDRRPGTVGFPIPGCEVRIVDESGGETPEGEPGEILVRSNGIMTGYWRRPEDTAASFRDGWFATGDMARRDRDGYVTIAGRKSVDFIKSGGFKISAREIEDVLRRHPRVRDVAVVGAPDRVWGERILAAVVLESAAGPAPTSEALLEELSSFCGRSLADYKRPREIRILEELPRNALGKVQKHRILEGKDS